MMDGGPSQVFGPSTSERLASQRREDEEVEVHGRADRGLLSETDRDPVAGRDSGPNERAGQGSCGAWR